MYTKKILMVLVIICQCLIADVYFKANPERDNYEQGEQLTIELYSDSNIIYGVRIENVISDGGVASDSYFADQLWVMPNVFSDQSHGTVINSDGILISTVSGYTLFAGSPKEPGELIYSFVYTCPMSDGLYTISAETPSITADLDGVIGGMGTINPVSIQVGEVAEEPTGEPVSFSCETAGKYADNGSVEYPEVVYEDSVVTVTAVPDEGYRVQKWVGADSSSPVAVQTVTVGSKARRVRVYFEPEPEEKVSKAVFKAGKSRDAGSVSDMFLISGVLAAGADDIPEEAGTVTVKVLSADDQELFNDSFTYGDENAAVGETIKAVWPKVITYKNAYKTDGVISLFKYSVTNGRFTVSAIGQDLSGWSSPLTLEVSIGDYEASLEMADGDDDGEDVINGRADMPGQFLIGVYDGMTVSTASEKVNSKTSLASGFVKGSVTTSSDPSTLATVNVIMGDWESGDLTLTRAKKGNKYTYIRPKKGYGETDYITAIILDMDRAMYVIKYKNADLGDSDEFDLEFTYQ